jgi:hypothetical protein
MKFLDSPNAFLASVFLAVGVFGIGLTAPLWFMLAGLGPLEAVRAGTPIVIATIVGLGITAGLGLAIQRLRNPTADAAEPAPPEPAGEQRKHVIVHVVTMLMFIVPFATIILGMLLHKVIDWR